MMLGNDSCSMRVSLVPRPYPLMRKKSLVNQLEFLALVHTFTTVSPNNIQTFYTKPAQNGMNTQVEIKKFTIAIEVPHNLTISMVLNTFGEYTQEIRLCSPDCFSPKAHHCCY